MLTFILISIFTLGLIIGSFLNCLIWRLHTGETILGRSYCPKCQQQIAWYDNIPVLSYIFLLGKCRHCKKHISIQYPVVEFVVGLLFVLAFVIELRQFQFFNFQFFNLFILLFRDWFVIFVMTIVFVYDLRWYLILDKIMIPAMIIIFGLNIYLAYLDGEVFNNLWNFLISGIIGGGFFLLQFLVSRGQWIGGGDIRLGFFMGLVLGWPIILLALMLAYISGAIIGVFLLIWGKKKMSSQIPFGVFLSTATLVSLFWGQSIINWYLNLL